MDAGPLKPEQDAGPRKGAGLTFALLAVAGFSVGANMRITDPLLPTIAAEFSTTVGAAAVVAMVFALAHGALQIVYGPLGDRVGKLLVVAVAAVAAAVISFLTAQAWSLASLAGLRLLCGVAAASVVPLSLAYIGDTTTYAERYGALARLSGAILIGLMCGQVIGGLIAEFWGWRAVFYCIGAAFAAAGTGLLLSPALRAERHGRGKTAQGGAYAELFRLFKRPAARHLFVAVAAQGGISFTTAAFIGAHLHDHFGLSLAAIGAMLSLFAAGGIAYAFATAKIITLFGERGALAVGGLLFGACFLVMAFAQHWQVFAPALFLAGIGVMMVHNLFQVSATQLAPEARGTALSLFAAMIFLGQTAGFAIASPVYDHFGVVPILLTAAVGFPLIVFDFRHRMRSH